MGRSISESLIWEGRSSFSRSACQNCCRRKDCPYSCDRALERSLRRAAAQGRAAAQLLTAESERLLEEISCADCTDCLLTADEAVKCVLSNALYEEITLLESFPAS